MEAARKILSNPRYAKYLTKSDINAVIKTEPVNLKKEPEDINKETDAVKTETFADVPNLKLENKIKIETEPESCIKKEIDIEKLKLWMTLLRKEEELRKTLTHKALKFSETVKALQVTKTI